MVFFSDCRSQNDLPELARPDRIEADRRLVQEQDLRIVQQRAGDVQALLHAARVALDLLVAPVP